MGPDQQTCRPSCQSTEQGNASLILVNTPNLYKVSIRLISEPGKEVGLLLPLPYKYQKPQTFLSPDGLVGR